MNKYDKLIIFIMLKICRIIGKYTDEEKDTIIFTIEEKLKELNEDE